MALIVQKYGGTSVGDVERLRHVARRIVEVSEAGNQVVVVVSAIAGETDRLLQLAHQITETPNARELDVILATGEQVAIGLLSLAIQAGGSKARSFTGTQVRILTDNVHTRARILNIDVERIRQALREGEITIVAGFQGVNAEEEVTTLGRGGSDLTAVALAAALNADVCEIYTDVEGVYTADPGLVSTAQKLPRISYEEMIEIASLGARVLQARAVEYAKNYNMSIHVRSSFTKNPGTLVVQEDQDMEKVAVSGIAYDKNEAKITITGVVDRPGIAAKLFGRVAEAGIVVDMIVQNISQDGHTDISFTIPRSDFHKASELVDGVAKEIGAGQILGDDRIAKVSIVGVGMRTHSGVAARMFTALAAENINIMMISTSEIKVSCVIEEKYTELAVRVLHDAFQLGVQPIGEG
ncbi:MAG: aspartate kinase [candidate division NC10 bacterium]|nr:aspartate kinase [candidate division NC10 bacterium]MCH7897128.1 aspartate kinase [candidate division NC10 bacterium]MCZ6551899.1 aspartate kinase [candidate division NC10 bacterium]